MSIAFSGAKGLSVQMQEALCHVKGKRVMMFKGFHESLAYFRCLAEDVTKL